MKELLRSLAIQEYRMYSGFKYDEEKIKNYQKEVAKKALKEIKDADDKHYKLWLLDIIADEVQSNLFLKQIKLRGSVNVGKINYANWKVWLPRSTPEERKKFIDTFLSKAGAKLENIIRQRFSKIKQVYDKYGEDVLTAYAIRENINLKKAISRIKSEGMKQKSVLNSIWKDMGVEREYWNEYYFLSTTIYKGINFNLEPIPYIKKIYKKFGLPFSKLTVDDKDRKNKFGFAYCFWPNPPYDVRVSYKPVGGFNVFETAFHEFGHAAHALSMDPHVPFWKRYAPPNGIAETFSELFESIATNKKYLKSIGVVDKKLERRIKLSYAKFLTFYTANSLVKFKYWGGEIKFDEIGQVYSELLKKYTGIRNIPDKYWVLHHIISESTLYAPSYILADFRKDFLLRKLRKFGDWWNNKEAGDLIKRYMAPAYDAIYMFDGFL
jgi:hypothetical protein